MRRRELPPNVWRRCLKETDWNFALCKNEELEPCLRWEIYREKAQAENGGAFPEGFDIVYDNFIDARRVPLPSQEPKGRRVKRVWLSYIEMRNQSQWKPLKKERLSTSHYLQLGWGELARGWRDEVEYAFTHFPSPPIMDGSGTTEIFPIRIPWKWRDAEIVAAFKEWLKENRPKGDTWDERGIIAQNPNNKSGGGSRRRQARAKLKALAAWRLLQHFNGNRTKIDLHGKAMSYLGDTYGNSSEWISARKIVEKAIQSFPYV